MRVFILCTGRSGSTTFIKACKHITNFSSAHESRSKMIGKKRLNYKDDHIEADNRLSWFLGQMDKKYGNEPFYVLLKRERNATVKSINKRWETRVSIVKAFSQGILKTPVELLNEEKKKKICSDYYDCVHDNIELFLKDKERKMTLNLENIQSEFPVFWKYIGAKGNLEKALQEFERKYNKSPKKPTKFTTYDLKLLMIRISKLFRR